MLRCKMRYSTTTQLNTHRYTVQMVIAQYSGTFAGPVKRVHTHTHTKTVRNFRETHYRCPLNSHDNANDVRRRTRRMLSMCRAPRNEHERSRLVSQTTMLSRKPRNTTQRNTSPGRACVVCVMDTCQIIPKPMGQRLRRTNERAECHGNSIHAPQKSIEQQPASQPADHVSLLRRRRRRAQRARRAHTISARERTSTSRA